MAILGVRGVPCPNCGKKTISESCPPDATRVEDIILKCRKCKATFRWKRINAIEAVPEYKEAV